MLKIYHPFINGPNGDFVKQMQMDYPDVRINIPPLSVMKDEIAVAGEKDGVLAIVEKIKETAKILVSLYSCRHSQLHSLCYKQNFMMRTKQTYAYLNERIVNYYSCPH